MCFSWSVTNIAPKIAITPADKGGRILIVDPKLPRRKTLDKLQNPNLYEKLDTDPLHKLHAIHHLKCTS